MVIGCYLLKKVNLHQYNQSSNSPNSDVTYLKKVKLHQSLMVSAVAGSRCYLLKKVNLHQSYQYQIVLSVDVTYLKKLIYTNRTTATTM